MPASEFHSPVAFLCALLLRWELWERVDWSQRGTGGVQVATGAKIEVCTRLVKAMQELVTPALHKFMQQTSADQNRWEVEVLERTRGRWMSRRGVQEWICAYSNDPGRACLFGGQMAFPFNNYT